ncbi:MAG: MOSC domain-containing protein [Chlorobiota bacterium]|nr:MOSC domain-containing protein [Chlorobiota bacterium]QQS67717.1 MAG: MOSC domain-containing protein [Chlorobiota bacterium]
MKGHIFQINHSNGGVPKFPIFTSDVNEYGLISDIHNDMNHHGGLDRAICLYSLELILKLQKEGNHIFPGSIGENITTTNVDFNLFQPGRIAKFGNDLILEVTSFTTPCSTIKSSFKNDYFNRISHDLNPGWSRVNCKVIKLGTINTSDLIEII